MTTSGTVSQTVFDIGRVIDTSLRRCRIPSELVTPEMQEIAKDVLYLLLSSWPGRGIQLWTNDVQTLSFTQGAQTLPMPVGTVDLAKAFLRNSLNPSDPTDIELARISQDDYMALPNKSYQGRPVMYWLNRQRDVPVMNLWPTADLYTITNCQLLIYRQRHIQDVGSDLTASLDIPQRWYEALCWQLAWRLAAELKEVDDAVAPRIKALAEEAFQLAQDEERDASPMRLIPDLSAYTR